MDRRRRYPKAFIAAARQYLDANPWCVYCEEAGRREPSTLVDHIRPIARRGPVMDKQNWAACCRHCHDGWIKRLERGGYYIPACTVSGAPVTGPITERAVQAKGSERALKDWDKLREWGEPLPSP